jgi:hypothetical protein
MGLLKHVLLPAFSLLHAAGAKTCLVDESFDVVVGENVVPKRDLKKEPTTPTEKHLIHAIGGVQLAFLINNVCAIITENAHYRGMALLLEAIFLGCDSFSYYKMGCKTEGAVKMTYALFGLSLLGLSVHAMEPGIFTKDKTKV